MRLFKAEFKKRLNAFLNNLNKSEDPYDGNISVPHMEPGIRTYLAQ